MERIHQPICISKSCLSLIISVNLFGYFLYSSKVLLAGLNSKALGKTCIKVGPFIFQPKIQFTISGYSSLQLLVESKT